MANWVRVKEAKREWDKIGEWVTKWDRVTVIERGNLKVNLEWKWLSKTEWKKMNDDWKSASDQQSESNWLWTNGSEWHQIKMDKWWRINSSFRKERVSEWKLFYENFWVSGRDLLT